MTNCFATQKMLLVQAYKDYLVNGSNAYLEYLRDVELVPIPDSPIKGSIKVSYIGKITPEIACTRELRAELPKTGIDQTEVNLVSETKREEN